MAANWFSAPAPTTHRVRGYFAPVDRIAQVPEPFDAAQHGQFNLDAPPAPWISLGWVQEFVRKPQSKTMAVLTGVPAGALEQVRETIAAEVSLQFLSWTKLTMALATGAQHMNLLAPQSTDMSIPVPAVTVQNGSTDRSLVLNTADAASFTAGQIVAVDIDYAGQTGFVGLPVAGAYLRKPLNDVDYVRRVTFNIGLISEVSESGLTLATPLLGGPPITGAKLQAVTGFVDREGGSFYQEWSGLFVLEGSQGERVFFYYPRLQPMASTEESISPLDNKNKDGQSRVLLKGQYLAMPVNDPRDGERVVCYRSFIPAPKAMV